MVAALAGQVRCARERRAVAAQQFNLCVVAVLAVVVACHDEILLPSPTYEKYVAEHLPKAWQLLVIVPRQVKHEAGWDVHDSDCVRAFDVFPCDR